MRAHPARRPATRVLLGVVAAVGCSDVPPAGPGRPAIDAALPVVALGPAAGPPAAVWPATAASLAVSTSGSTARSSRVVVTVEELTALSGSVLPFPRLTINEAGQVAGAGELPAGRHAFLWSRTAGVTDLGTLGGFESEAADVNARAQVVGTSDAPTQRPDAPFRRRAFLWQAGSGMRDLGTLPGYEESEAHGVNDSAQVVGFTGLACDVPGECRPPHAFLWKDGAGMTDLGTLPGGLDSYAYAVNNAGQVVGFTAAGPPPDSNVARAFLWERGRGMVSLGTLGGLFSLATGINDAGQVVGSSSIETEPVELDRAFLWERGRGMVDLGTLPGDEVSGASAINNAGQVVGNSLRTVSLGEGEFIVETRPALWQPGGGVVALPLLAGDVEGSATDINDAGQAVGVSGDPDFGGRPVLWTIRPVAEGAPSVDRLAAAVLPPGNRTGLTGVWLRVRLRDPGDAGPWDWAIDWGEGPPTTLRGLKRSGEFAFLRAALYTTPGPHTITVTATDPGGLTSAVATTVAP